MKEMTATEVSMELARADKALEMSGVWNQMLKEENDRLKEVDAKNERACRSQRVAEVFSGIYPVLFGVGQSDGWIVAKAVKLEAALMRELREQMDKEVAK